MSMTTEVKWVDLSLIDVFMGSFRDASHEAGLAIVDMNSQFDREIRALGFLPSNKNYSDGVYYMMGSTIIPSRLRDAFGADNVKIVTGERPEINRIFTAKVSEKTRMNSNAYFAQQKPLGFNHFGDLILESLAGRYFVRKDLNRKVAVYREADLSNDPAVFLRAVDLDTLRRVCDGFVGRIISRNEKLNRSQIVDLIAASNDAGFSPREYQEAIEAAMNRLLHSEMDRFKSSGLVNFDIANRLYLGMPELRERTSNSIANQQYSTTLPLAALAQAMLASPVQLRGASVLDPTIGNANLVTTIGRDGAHVYGVEIDEDRVTEAERVATVLHSDATSIDFRAVFGVRDGFDYVIANPPFGSLDAVERVKTPNGSLIAEIDTQRLDHLILLKSLHARAPGGRAVFITGADNALGNGEARGRSRYLLNYLFDHYHVEGVVDVSGDLYKKQGATFPVRLMVVGARKAVPVPEAAPEVLPVIRSYGELRNWAVEIVEKQNPMASLKRVPAPTAPSPVQSSLASIPFDLPIAIEEPVVALPVTPDVEDVVPVSTVDADDSEQWRSAIAADPRLQALISGGVEESLVLQAARELAAGDDELLLDLARIQGVEVSPADKVVAAEPSAREALAQRIGIHRGVLAEENPFGELSSDWVAMNALRPLVGHQVVNNGEMLRGRFYAAIDLSDETTARLYVEQNLKDDASTLVVADANLQAMMAVVDGGGRYLEQYLAMTPEARLQAAQPLISRLKGKNVRDLLALRESAQTRLDALASHRPTRPREDAGTRFKATHTTPMGDEVAAVGNEWVDAEGTVYEGDVYLIESADAVIEEVTAIPSLTAESLQDYVVSTIERVVYEMTRNNEAARHVVGEVESTDFAINEVLAGHPALKNRRQDIEAYKAYADAAKAFDYGAVRLRVIGSREVVPLGAVARAAVPLKPEGAEVPISAPAAEDLREDNDYQQPYVAASNCGEVTTMIPVNLSGPVYAALARIREVHGDVDEYMAHELDYAVDKLGDYFSPEQVDAIAMIVHAQERDLGFLLADKMGVGKGRVLAAVARHARLHGRIPTFITVGDSLFTDFLERDIAAIGSRDLFQNVMIINDGSRTINEKGEVVVKSIPRGEFRRYAEEGELPAGTDMIMLTYSQICRSPANHLTSRYMGFLADRYPLALLLDESHNGAGASNTGNNLCAMIDGVAGRGTVLYSSGTPIKGAKNLRVYKKILPKGINPDELLDVVASDPLSLQEALNYEIAVQGCLISRELDNSNFETTYVMSPDQARNREIADQMAQILTGMAYMSGDVKEVVTKLNKKFQKELEEMSEDLKKGSRMGASSMNFGSRLFQINRQFLLALKARDVVELVATAIEENRKPIVAVRHTGESLLRDFVTNANESYEETPDRTSRQMNAVVLSEPVTFKDLMRRYLERLQWIKVQGRYGDVSFARAGEGNKELSEQMARANAHISELINDLPDDLPLTPIDYLRTELGKRGYSTGEISGRNLQARYLDSGGMVIEPVPGRTDKTRVTRAVREFNNGEKDVLVLTESGCTGQSMQASPAVGRDIRPRRMIKWEMQPDIAKERQMDGRHNRKGQVADPETQIPMTGLPADDRLSMMFNNKNRSLTSSTVSNRDSSEIIRDVPDLLNVVGDQVARELLEQSPTLAERLDIDMPTEKEKDAAPTRAPLWFIGKLTGRIALLPVAEQESLYADLQSRFTETLDRLKAEGRNPLEVVCHDWRAKCVDREIYMGSESNVKDGSSFNSPVYLSTVEYQVKMTAIRADEIDQKIDANSMGDLFTSGHVFGPILQHLVTNERGYLAGGLSKRYDTVEAALSAADGNDVKNTKAKLNWLLRNLPYVRVGGVFAEPDLEGNVVPCVVLHVNPPMKEESYLRLSDYSIFVIRPGSEQVEMRHLSALFANDVQFLSETFDRQPMIRDAFDNAENGVVTRRARILGGNLFEAVSLNLRARLGYKVVYTDDSGARQHGILVRSEISDHKLMQVCERVREPKVLMALMDQQILLTSHPEGLTVGKEVALLMQRERGGGVSIRVQGSKSGGGDIYLDPVLSRIRGDEAKNRFGMQFSMMGGRMGATISEEHVESVLTYLVETKGVNFYVKDRDALNRIQNPKAVKRERCVEMA